MKELLETKRIRLRRITNDDLSILFGWRNDENFIQNCSNRRNKVDYEEFIKEFTKDFERDRHIQFMVERIRDKNPIGAVYSYGYKSVDKYAFITTYLADGFRKFGYGAEALALFLEYLFETFGLHKIYFEVYEYNAESLKGIVKAGFVEEGRFKEQRLWNGKRYDVLRYAVFRNDIPRILEFIDKLINRRNLIMKKDFDCDASQERRC